MVRTIAKPIGNAIKSQAKEHERFRKLCIKFAQSMHSTEIKLRMSLLGENKIRVKPLNDNKAIEQGATFISEFFIFSVAGSLILYESYRSRKKASNERDALADDITVLQSEIEYIKTKLGDINIKLDDYKVPEGYKPKYIKLENNNGNKNNSNDNSTDTKNTTISEVSKTEETKP